MMGWSPRCNILSFVEIGPVVPEKVFEGFLPCMGLATILIMFINFHLLVPKSLHRNFC